MTDSQPQRVLPVAPAPMMAIPVHVGDANDVHSVSAEPGAMDILRLRSFVKRLAIVGAILGSVIFLILFYVIVFVMPEVQPRDIDLSFDGLPKYMGTVLPAAALAMAVLVFFYSLRALSTVAGIARRPLEELWTPPDSLKIGRRALLPFLRSDLIKIRVAATVLLITFLLALATGAVPQNSRVGGLSPLNALILVAQVLGVLSTCWQLMTVRRARWEVARIEGASFNATQARGFAVLAAAVPGSPRTDLTTAGSVIATSLSIPADMPMVLSPDVAADLEMAGHADEFRDWEAMGYGIAILGILMGVLSFQSHFFTFFMSGRGILLGRSMSTYPGMPTSKSFLQSFEIFTALHLLAGAVAAAWTVWGVMCVCAGLRFRRLLICLIFFDLTTSAAVFLLSLGWNYDNTAVVGMPTPWYVSSQSIYGIGSDSGIGASPVLSLLIVTLFSLIALLVMTRQSVKSVFTHRPRGTKMK